MGAMTICSSIMQVFSLLFQGLSRGPSPLWAIITVPGSWTGSSGPFACSFSPPCALAAPPARRWSSSGPVLSRCLNDKPELVEIAVWALHIYAAGMFMLGVQFSCQQTFVALGQAKVSLFLALLRKIVLLIPLIYILPHFLSNQVFAVYLAEPVADVCAATCTGLVFLWKFPRILRERDASADPGGGLTALPSAPMEKDTAHASVL